MSINLFSPGSRNTIHTILVNLNGFDRNFFQFCEYIPYLENREIDTITYSVFNELQLIYGYRSVTIGFFYYLLKIDNLFSNGCTSFDEEIKHFNEVFSVLSEETRFDLRDGFTSLEQLNRHVDLFRIHALLFFGNVQRCFSIFSKHNNAIYDKVKTLPPGNIEEYKSRTKPLVNLCKIAPEDTFYLGYIVQKELESKLNEDKDNERLLSEKQKIDEIKKKGIYNHNAYLATEILDVYIATSMREKEDFYSVSKHINEIFGKKEIEELNLVYFDPTQAYCNNRIDKGLTEALMLKKALVTVYFVQEDDTLGKDSELASTLAQGKPVIAFIPEVNQTFFDEYKESLAIIHQNEKMETLFLNKIKKLNPLLAWNKDDKQLQGWIENENSINRNEIEERLITELKEKYDKRSDNLKNTHPLGIQVSLNDGVANGLLVVRTIEECTRLLRNLVTDRTEYELKSNEYRLFLEEKISGCVYRLETKDVALSNTFWNYYV